MLADLSFKRYYYRNEKEVYTQELHRFLDASQDGCACVIYLCVVVYTDGTVDVDLVYSRSKVAPLTIPKLELCGSLLYGLRPCVMGLKSSSCRILNIVWMVCCWIQTSQRFSSIIV